MKNNLLFCLILFILCGFGLFDTTAGFTTPPNHAGVSSRTVVYKTIGDVKLKLHIYEPANRDKTKPVSAIVFFFGGGWVGGSPAQFSRHCKYLASRGMVACSAEYRIKKKHGTTPIQCVEDGKSAVRYLRENAKKLGIDPNHIAAGGGSAGGHVAACTGVIESFDNPKENQNISSKPNAMVLFNPVIDTTKKGYGWTKIPGDPKSLSPAHHVKKGLPPTIIFHGTADTTVPFENVARFTKLMKKAGNRCELMSFKGMKHGFFNYGRAKNIPYIKINQQMDTFLVSLGWLKEKPTTKQITNQTAPPQPTPKTKQPDTPKSQRR